MGGSCGTPQKSAKDFLNPEQEKLELALDEDAEMQNAYKQSERIVLHFQCKSVRELGIGFEPTSILVLSEKKAENTWEKLGSTEMMLNDLNPNFVKGINVIYSAQELQKMLIEIFELLNEDDPDDPEGRTLLGSGEFMLIELVNSKDKTITLQLKDKRKKAGLVSILFEARNEPKKIQTIGIQAKIEPCKDLASDYYFKIYRPLAKKNAEMDNGITPAIEEKNIIVYNSRYGRADEENNAYTWAKLKEPAKALVLDDLDTPITFEVGINKKASAKEKKGVAQKLFEKITTISAIQKHGVDWVLNIEEEGKEELTEKFDKFRIAEVTLEEEYRFTDYIKAGASLKLAVSIDFTLTNKNPMTKVNFHTENLEENPYALLIRALGNPIMSYDYDKRVLGLGHGAKLPVVGRTFCFALNGNIFDPETTGLGNLLEYYLYALKKIKMGGPTYLAEVINYHADVVELYVNQAAGKSIKYYTHLIFVDGTPLDVDEIKDALVKCASLPISVIIVGINELACQGMRDMFNPAVPIVSKKQGITAMRNTVQYVTCVPGKHNLQKIAMNIMLELQRQFVDYMSSNKIDPTSIKVISDQTTP